MKKRDGYFVFHPFYTYTITNYCFDEFLNSMAGARRMLFLDFAQGILSCLPLVGVLINMFQGEY